MESRSDSIYLEHTDGMGDRSPAEGNVLESMANDLFLSLYSIEIFPCTSHIYDLEVHLVSRDLSRSILQLYSRSCTVDNHLCQVTLNAIVPIPLDGDAHASPGRSIFIKLQPHNTPEYLYWLIFPLLTRKPQLKRLPLNFADGPLELSAVPDSNFKVIESTSHVYFSINNTYETSTQSEIDTVFEQEITSNDYLVNISSAVASTIPDGISASLASWGREWISRSSDNATLIKSKIFQRVLKRHHHTVQTSHQDQI